MRKEGNEGSALGSQLRYEPLLAVGSTLGIGIRIYVCQHQILMPLMRAFFGTFDHSGLLEAREHLHLIEFDYPSSDQNTEEEGKQRPYDEDR